MDRIFFRLLFAAVALAFASGAQAADTKAAARLSGGDRHFVTQAAQDGFAEVELGRLAQQNGARQPVKDFGHRMMTDHGRANDELAAIAARLGVAPPTQPGSKHQTDIKKLSRLKGADFDREFAKRMVRDHEKTVQLFEKQAKNGEAAELKAYAARTLPVLQGHLKMAKGLSSTKKK